MSAPAHAEGGAKWGTAIGVAFLVLFMTGPASDNVKFAIAVGAIAFFVSNKKAAPAAH
jgi:hypothetical protein